MTDHKPSRRPAPDIQQLIGNTLRIGVTLACAIALVGGLLYLLQHGGEPAKDYSHFPCTASDAERTAYTTLGGIWHSLCAMTAFYTDVINPANRPDPNTNIFRKGFKPEEEQYSSFEAVGADGRKLSEVAGENLVISGIATEYCVYNTVKEFFNANHNIELLVSGLGYVDKDCHVKTLKELEKMVTVVK